MNHEEPQDWPLTLMLDDGQKAPADVLRARAIGEDTGIRDEAHRYAFGETVLRTQSSEHAPTEGTVATEEDGVGRSSVAHRWSVSGEAGGGAQYEIVREFARGGLGRILEAFDLRLGRRVAVKELLARGDSASWRFEREARLTARLQHPSIVPVHEYGRWPEGTPFYTMKLVRGQTLRRSVEAAASLLERLSLVSCVTAVAEAVAYAHSEGIVHRDIKPSNIMLGPFGETVLIDWGLAKELWQPDGAERRAPSLSGDPWTTEKTVEGSVLGTPEYMSPEQARGAPIDERTDVYALGAVLYFLLSGKAPYSGANAAEVLEKVIAGPPVPLEQLHPDVPGELASLVRKAMARSPEARYPTAKELAAELRRFQTGQMISAHQYSSWSMLGRWVRRYRAPVAIGALSLVALFVVGGYSVEQVVRERNHARSARSTAEARSQELTLLQARSSLDRDPTAAIAWLKTYPEGGPDEAAVRTIAADAWSRGVARHVWQQDDKAEQGDFSPDGRWLATSEPDGIYLWDIVQGRRAARWARRATNDLRFTADSRQLISIGNDGTIVFHAVPSGAARMIRAHEGRIRSFQLAPGGQSFVTVGDDGAVRLWDLSGEGHRELGRHHGIASGVDFAPDGSAVVSVGRDGTMRLWPLDGRAPRVYSACSPLDVELVRFSRDGRTIALAGQDGRVLVRRTEDPQTCTVVLSHGGPVNDLAFSPDGRFLASASADGTVGLWDASQAAFLLRSRITTLGGGVVPGGRIIRGHADQVVSLAFAADGSALATGGMDPGVRVLDLESNEVRVLAGHGGLVSRVLFSRTGRTVATLAYDRKVRLWPLPRSTEQVLRGHTDDVNSVYFLPAFLPDSLPGAAGPRRALVSLSEDRTARIWDLETGTARILAGHRDGVYRASFSPDGRRMATSSFDHEVRVWDLAGSAPASVLAGHHNVVWQTAFAPDPEHLVSASRDGSVRFWDLISGTRETLGAHLGAIWGFALAPDGRALVTSGEDGVIRLWDLVGGGGRVIGSQTGSVDRVVYAPDGRSIASGGVDGTVRLWDLETGGMRVLRGHRGTIKSLAFSPDGRTLVSGGGDYQIRAWDVASGASQVLAGHEGYVRQLVFTPDGRYLLSLGWDRTVRTWDMAQGGRLRTIHRNPSLLLNLAIAPDGAAIAAGGWDHTVRVWPAGELTLPPGRGDLRAWMDAATTAEITAGDEVRTP